MRARLIAAFAAVYVIWGSTYLAIRFAVQTLPPLLMASARFVLAGVIVLLWARFRDGAAWPNRVEWRVGLISGALLLLGGNGAVSWAEFAQMAAEAASLDTRLIEPLPGSQLGLVAARPRFSASPSKPHSRACSGAAGPTSSRASTWSGT